MGKASSKQPANATSYRDQTALPTKYTSFPNQTSFSCSAQYSNTRNARRRYEIFVETATSVRNSDTNIRAPRPIPGATPAGRQNQNPRTNGKLVQRSRSYHPQKRNLSQKF